MNADDRGDVYRMTFDATLAALREQGFSKPRAEAIAEAEARQAAKAQGEAT